MHDPRVGRFFAVDPLQNTYVWNSSYAFSENRVVDKVELEGGEILDLASKAFDYFVGEEEIKKSTTLTVMSAYLNNQADRGDPMRIAQNMANHLIEDPVDFSLTYNLFTGPTMMAKHMGDKISEDYQAAIGESESTTQAEGIVNFSYDIADVCALFYGASKAGESPTVKPNPVKAPIVESNIAKIDISFKVELPTDVNPFKVLDLKLPEFKIPVDKALVKITEIDKVSQKVTTITPTKTQWGWSGTKVWKDLVNKVKGGGTIENLEGKIPTLEEAKALIKESGGKIERIEEGHSDPNPHTYPHINYSTSTNSKGTIQVQSIE